MITHERESLLSSYPSDAIAKYIRLSLADEAYSSDESESVANQRRLLNEFIDKNGGVSANCREFIDDGCSGTNFERPGWQKLLGEMDNGKIKVVITKNLSRLGRSNFECSFFLDYYFPNNHIRYFALQEQIDTGNQENANNEYAALNNFINEKYSRDLSKNIKKVYKIKQYAGEYMGSIPLYGYRKDPIDKHRLVIDEEAATVVRRIFQLYLKTESQYQIKTILSREKILIPEVYKKTRRGLQCKNPYEWNYHTIRDILRNEMYIGNMVQNVFSKKSFREKKMVKHPKDEWIIVPNAHEPIIDSDTFYRVQELLAFHYRKSSTSSFHLLSGFLYCHECGHRIGIGKQKRQGKIYWYTYCNYYRKQGKCTTHSMNYDTLEEMVCSWFKSFFKKNCDLIPFEKIFKRVIENFHSPYHDLLTQKENLILAKKKVEVELERLYMDRLEGLITKEMYQKICDKITSKKKDLEYQVECLRKTIRKYPQEDSFWHTLTISDIQEKYVQSRLEGSTEVLLKWIDKIELHQDKTIDIYLKCKI